MLNLLSGNCMHRCVLKKITWEKKYLFGCWNSWFLVAKIFIIIKPIYFSRIKVQIWIFCILNVIMEIRFNGLKNIFFFLLTAAKNHLLKLIEIRRVFLCYWIWKFIENNRTKQKPILYNRFFCIQPSNSERTIKRLWLKQSMLKICQWIKQSQKLHRFSVPLITVYYTFFNVAKW